MSLVSARQTPLQSFAFLSSIVNIGRVRAQQYLFFCSENIGHHIGHLRVLICLLGLVTLSSAFHISFCQATSYYACTPYSRIKYITWAWTLLETCPGPPLTGIILARAKDTFRAFFEASFTWWCILRSLGIHTPRYFTRSY